jgi:hypothetical protein
VLVNTTLRRITAWTLGIRDGWREPTDLSTSFNVDQLDDGYGSAHEAHDRGINLGQLLRAGRQSQAHREGWHHVLPWGW